MDSEMAERLATLKEQETDAHGALSAVLDQNATMVRLDQHADLMSPSYSEKRAMREQVIVAEQTLHDVQEQIRQIEWDAVGIVEGPAQVIGIDNVVTVDETERLMRQYRPRSLPDEDMS